MNIKKAAAVSAAVCMMLTYLCGCSGDISGVSESVYISESSAGEAVPAYAEETPDDTAAHVTQAPETITESITGTSRETTAASRETRTETSVKTEETEPQPEVTDTEPDDTAFFAEADTERFSERLHEIYSDYGIIGMSVAVFSGGEVIYTENIGYADRENNKESTDDTKYRAASVSKLASTILLMQLCDRGKLTVDSYLTDVTGIDFDYPVKDKMKLWHLLTHTAGIIDTYMYENGIIYKYDIEKILKKSHTGLEPGTVFNYCNFGAGAMGAVVESLTGEYFHSFAKKALFDPLGMDAAYVADYLKDRESCANIYDYDGEIFKVSEWGRTSEYYESFGLGNSYLTAQCELLISASDLARLGIVLSGDGTLDGKRVISKKAVANIHKEYFKTDEFGMGLNLRIYKGSVVEGRTIYGHPGNALGALNGLFYDPSDSTGVAILTNRCSVYMNEDNGMYGMLDETVKEAYECFFGEIR